MFLPACKLFCFFRKNIAIYVFYRDIVVFKSLFNILLILYRVFSPCLPAASSAGHISQFAGIEFVSPSLSSSCPTQLQWGNCHQQVVINCDICSSVGPYILYGASPFSVNQNVVYLALSGSSGRGPSHLVDIPILEQGACYDHVAFITEVTQPFSIVIDSTYTHQTVPVIVPGSGIQVSQHHGEIVCWDLISHCLQLVVKASLCVSSASSMGAKHVITVNLVGFKLNLALSSLDPDGFHERPLHFAVHDQGHSLCLKAIQSARI